MNKQGIFTQLEKQKGTPLTDNEIDKVLEHLEIPQNTNGNYIDAFNRDISYNGIKTLKRPYTQLSLTPDHLNELEVCRNDIFYFVRYYCKILTKNGITRPEIRDYQNEFLGMLSSGDDVIASLPRQCVAGETKITINGNEISIKDFFENSKKELLQQTDELFLESYKLNDAYTAESPFGNLKVDQIHKTKKFQIFKITLENGLTLHASENHVIIGKNDEEIHIKECLNKVIKTKFGLSRVISKEYINNDYCYDLSLRDFHLYYTNGILSHNSGKSVTSGLYLLWIANFTPNINIGIAGNKLDLAMEVLDKIKKIFTELPMWMKQGIEAWNKTYIQFENGTRILTSATSGDSFRGYSVHLLLIDEVAFVSSEKWTALEDSVFPAQDALSKKQKILISTPNGMGNQWYHLVSGAINNKNGYRYFSTDWKKIPRYNRDGTQKEPNVFKDEIIRKHGKRYFAQNYELEFLGSSNTLISAYALKNLEPCDENIVSYNTLFDGLRIFEEPIKNNHYIVGVDPNKCGIDNLAIQVLNVTELPFKQVASYNSNISYLNAPSKIFDLGRHYNNAMIIVENNIDNSIVDTLYYQYEYDGEIYKEKNKNLLGFRTTKKTKKILLSILKKLIEENKLIIKDKKTIDELFVFVEQQNGSFSAQDGFKDDLVMALCVCLAPFIEIKDFEDFQTFLKFIETENELLEKEQNQMRELFVGFSFSTEITDEDIDVLGKETLSFDY